MNIFQTAFWLMTGLLWVFAFAATVHMTWISEYTDDQHILGLMLSTGLLLIPLYLMGWVW